MVKVQRWVLQTMDSASGKDVVLQKNMHLHVDTGHHLQNASLFGPVTMVEGMIDGIISIGMEEMVHTVDAHQ
jgi:hypothetical protein